VSRRTDKNASAVESVEAIEAAGAHVVNLPSYSPT
jgi:hypothetical protein